MFNRIFRVGSFFFERRTIHKKIIYELTIDNMLMSLGRDRISLKWWYLIHFRFQIDPNSDTTRTLTAAQLRCELSEIDLVSEWRHIQCSRNDVDEQRRSALLCELTIELHVMKPTHARAIVLKLQPCAALRWWRWCEQWIFYSVLDFTSLRRNPLLIQ